MNTENMNPTLSKIHSEIRFLCGEQNADGKVSGNLAAKYADKVSVLSAYGSILSQHNAGAVDDGIRSVLAALDRYVSASIEATQIPPAPLKRMRTILILCREAAAAGKAAAGKGKGEGKGESKA